MRIFSNHGDIWARIEKRWRGGGERGNGEEGSGRITANHRNTRSSAGVRRVS